MALMSDAIKRIIGWLEKAGGIQYGEWWDHYHRVNPETGELELIDVTPVRNNKIVLKSKELTSGLYFNEGSFTGGILYHGIGEGLVSWDTNLPDPNLAQTQLVTELDRKVPVLDYIDSSDVIVTPTITDKLLITTVLASVEALLDGKDLREQGLFGGDATAAANSGFMINAINHKKVAKVNGIQLTRFIRLQF